GERLLPAASRVGAFALTGTVVRVGERRVELSVTEAGLFAALAHRAGAVVAKADLLRTVWADPDAAPHVVEVTVGRLRRRLGPEGRSIEAVPRRGYVLRLPDPVPVG